MWRNSKFPTFKLYTVSEKYYITKGIQPIFKNFLVLKDVENRYLAEKFHGAAILVLQW